MEHFSKYNGINLYVKHLEDDVNEELLRKEFSAFGAIRSLKIVTDDKQHSRGFGFICYETSEEAQRAIAEMNNRPLTGTSKPLYVTFHEPKEIRRQKLAQEQLQRKQNVRSNMLQPVYPPAGYTYPTNAGPPQFMYPPQLIRQPPARGWTYPPSGTIPYQSSGQPPLPRNQGRNPASAVPRSKQIAGGQRRPPQQQQQSEVHQLSVEQLAMHSPEQQRLLVGEKLYALIWKKQPERAGKITGMLLDSGWGVDELLSLLESEVKLNQKIDEAVNVLLNISS